MCHTHKATNSTEETDLLLHRKKPLARKQAEYCPQVDRLQVLWLVVVTHGWNGLHVTLLPSTTSFAALFMMVFCSFIYDGVLQLYS